MTTNKLPDSKWSATLAEYHAAKAALEADTKALDQDAVEELGERYDTAFKSLFALPAPDTEALLAKLNIVFEWDEDEETTPTWSKEFIAQTLADMRTLLPRSPWDKMKAEVERLQAVAAADLKFGEHAKATNAREWAKGTAAQGKAADRLQRAEIERAETILQPLWAACRRLINTPAPDTAALAYKVALIDLEGFDVGDPEIIDPWAIISADAARLAN